MQITGAQSWTNITVVMRVKSVEDPDRLMIVRTRRGYLLQTSQ
jgi:hypothetical protein